MLPVYKTPLHVFNYDEIPAGYYYDAMLHGSAVQRFWHRQKFIAVASRLQDGDKVLDLGCGPGSFLSVLGETRPNIEAIGLDIASSQIEFAMKAIAPRFNGRIQFQQHDASDIHLPFPDHSFDAITSIEVIEHIHPYIAYKMLEESKRLLRPGGRILVTTPNYRSIWPLIELGLQKVSPVKYHEQHINKFTPNSFVKFLESVGLEVRQFSTLFIMAPFLAGLSWKTAERLSGLEQKSRVRLGSLLLAEAVPSAFNN
jgi:ubiquinone/menaquinone biosynthesis C-methylase UbiE